MILWLLDIEDGYFSRFDKRIRHIMNFEESFLQLEGFYISVGLIIMKIKKTEMLILSRNKRHYGGNIAVSNSRN